MINDWNKRLPIQSHQISKMIEKEPMNLRLKFLMFKRKVVEKLVARYNIHLYTKCYKKDDMIGLRKTAIPTYYDLKKASELVEKKKTHFAAVYHEKILLSNNKEVLWKHFSMYECESVMRNIMMVPHSFPVNLFPSEGVILKIMQRKQASLLYLTQKRHKFLLYLQTESRQNKQENVKELKIYDPDDDFRLSMITYSKENSHENFKLRRKYQASNKMLTDVLNKNINQEEEDIKDIEGLIYKIGIIEEDTKLLPPTRKRLYNLKTMKEQGMVNIDKMIEDKLMITNLRLLNNKRTTTANDPKTPNNNMMSLNINTFGIKTRKFKPVHEFVARSLEIETKKKVKSNLVESIIKQYNFMRRESEYLHCKYSPRLAGHETKLYSAEGSYRKEEHLAWKTNLLLSSIEAKSIKTCNTNTPKEILSASKNQTLVHCPLISRNFNDKKATKLTSKIFSLSKLSKVNDSKFSTNG